MKATLEADSIDAALAALADPVRRRTIELLAVRPHRVGELAEALGIASPAMSKHLRVLREGGLVSDSHPPLDARVRVYALRTSAFVGLRDWLDRAEQGWTEQLGAFADHVRAEYDR